MVLDPTAWAMSARELFAGPANTTPSTTGTSTPFLVHHSRLASHAIAMVVPMPVNVNW
jgi:hypothetical protein